MLERSEIVVLVRGKQDGESQTSGAPCACSCLPCACAVYGCQVSMVAHVPACCMALLVLRDGSGSTLLCPVLGHSSCPVLSLTSMPVLVRACPACCVSLHLQVVDARDPVTHLEVGPTSPKT